VKVSGLSIFGPLLALAWLLAACAPSTALGPSPAPTNGPAGPPLPTAQVRQGSGGLSCPDPFGGEEIAFSLAGWSETDFCQHSVDIGEIVPGGQPRDGIPPIESPAYESVDSASAWMGDGWPVLALVGSDEVFGYPLPILLWHEVVNTIVDGVPVAITYSPMSGSARAFAGRGLSGTPLVFGTTGNLRFGNSILYDRSSASWWQQLSGEGIIGELTGSSLGALPTQVLAWSDFRAEYPRARVLSRATGAVREYGTSPYAGLDDSGDLPGLLRSFVPGEVDGRLRPMARVTALPLDGGAVAFPFGELSTARVVNDEADGQPVVVFWGAGAVSLTDAARVDESRDVGSSGTYRRDLAGQVLTFEWTEGEIRDRETGSSWSLAGRAVAGPLQGQQLTRLVSVEAYWFAWSAIFPETRIWAP